ncbi:hypothetical protein ABW20_dc0105373 [Dactylellina cionopaga]|nr:hypothetical protein ABW20_dc0105373 [Dactylellina cionopaga]
MACGEGGSEPIYDAQTCQSLKSDLAPRCTSMISDCYKTGNTNTCSQAAEFCEGEVLFGLAEKNGIVVDDIRERTDGRMQFMSTTHHYQMGQSPSIDFLRSPEVMEALGAEGHNFDANNNVMELFHMSGDIVFPMQRYMPEVLKQIPALVFSGDKDLICNWLGVKGWTEALDWTGKVAFNAAQLQPYMANGAEAGQIKGANGLTFARIYDAGHTADASQPEAVLQLINDFMQTASKGSPQANQPSNQNPITSPITPSNPQSPGQVPSSGQYPTSGQIPSPGQIPPSGQVPTSGQVTTSGQYPSSGQVPPAGQIPPSGQIPQSG